MLRAGMLSVSLPKGTDSLQGLCSPPPLQHSPSGSWNWHPKHFLQLKARSWCLDWACGGQILLHTEHYSTLGTEDVWSRRGASCKGVFLAGMICFRRLALRHGHVPHFPALDTSHVNIPVNMFSFQLHCL